MTARVFTSIDRNLAESLFAAVASETRQLDGGGNGVCRPSYGDGETAAWRIVAATATDLGLHAEADAAGNLVVTTSPRSPKARSIWVGSHLDSVPHGGNYDGLAGVIAAVLLVAKAREVRANLPVVGVGLRGEESAWFGVPYLGSKALLGKLKEGDLSRRRQSQADDPGVPRVPMLGVCMEEIGVEPLSLLRGPVVAPDQIGAFWELHIEQGPLLAARGKPVGVVTGIRGSARTAGARIFGRAGHSGTTPHELRDDAVVRFAEVMAKLEARRRKLTELGDDLVFTCGVVSTNPRRHAITKIADEVSLSLDVRSLDDRIARDFLSYAASLGVDLGEVVTTPGATIAPETWRRALRACEDLGVACEVMPSGAGHDAAVFQQAGIPAGMIFVRNENGSHNPDEAMDTGDFMLGCEVLWRAITGSLQ